MRHLTKKIILYSVAIALVAYLYPGFSYNSDLKTLILASVALAFINLFIKPLIKIMFIPINLITLGLAGWFINVVILYLATLIVPGFSVQPFTLSLFNTQLVLSLFWAYVTTAFTLSFVTNFISWIIS